MWQETSLCSRRSRLVSILIITLPATLSNFSHPPVTHPPRISPPPSFPSILIVSSTLIPSPYRAQNRANYPVVCTQLNHKENAIRKDLFFISHMVGLVFVMKLCIKLLKIHFRILNNIAVIVARGKNLFCVKRKSQFSFQCFLPYSYHQLFSLSMRLFFNSSRKV